MSNRNSGPRRGRGLVAAVGVGAISALVAATVGAAPVSASPTAATQQPGRQQVPDGVHGAGSVGLGTVRSGSGKVDSALAAAKGRVDVMIELDVAPASQAFGLARARGASAAAAAARSQTAAVKRAQASVEARFAAPATAAQTLYRAHAAYAGVAVRTDAARLAALAALPGVRAVHRLIPKKTSNSSSVPLIGAPKAWKARGQTGQNVRVGIIDTGIDYTHADFGGPGTAAAFAAAKASPTFTRTPKVVGGYDFAGDAYDADIGALPDPDPNPLDCNGHGSHVAGTAAGFGVTSTGATYRGGYAVDIDPASLRIGPGVAPNALLYALKVFGCEGSTNVVTQALDWAADPNGDGDVSDHLDVVNMSLGSSFGSPQDPDATASNNLAALGTVVVASIGNSGDVYEVGGSPGNATRALAVAASDDGNDVLDGLKVDTPPGIEPADTIDGKRDNVFAAMKSVAYDWATKPGVTNTPVVEVGDWSKAPSDTNNIDGCSTYSVADAAKVKGKIVLQMWLDGEGRRCGSATRTARAREAGAVGAILGSDVNSFSAGITGDTDLPAMLTINQATKAIRGKLEAATPVEVRATLTNALRNSVQLRNRAAVDQLAGFSSRGVGVAGGVKPDVAAPGVTTFSVAVGTGNEGTSLSGTSMASPHVAGEAALVRGAHSGWTVEEVKAAIMNTATQDVFLGPNHTGAVYGPERVGSGRVVADQAVATTSLAYVQEDAGAVSVSFGPVAVTEETTTLTKTVAVVNKRPVGSASYTIAYQPAHPTPGVTYSFSPNELTLPPGGKANVKVTATITRSALRAVADPTTSTDPLRIGIKRSLRTDASGRMVLTPVGDTPGGALRVPVWSAPRPASKLAAPASATVTGTGPVKTGSLRLAGVGVAQGTGTVRYESRVSAFQLQGTSPALPACSPTKVTGCVATSDNRSADLRYVGAASDAPTVDALGAATLSFGIVAHGPWRTPAFNSEFDVSLDTNGDGTADAVVYNTRVVTTGFFDYFLSELVDLRPGRVGTVLDDQLINGVDGSVDTDLFNSDAMALPVSVGVLQREGLITDGKAKVRYWVTSFGSGGQVDALGSPTAPMTITVGSPALTAYGPWGTLLNPSGSGTTLTVRRDDASYVSDKPAGLLLLHHLNTNGLRGQVVTVRATSTTTLSTTAFSFPFGGRPILTATVSPSIATGTVSFKDNGTVLGTAPVSGGKAVLRVGPQPRGSHTMTAVYNGDGITLPSTSPELLIRVR
ncbi:MAG TPA: S8 family serine peptidase [Intrasporangium sp.]|uniref:S8 family serine peptidase n=1 Tax=Intrasporangium sp. TaxID=1925024 RepID=UPI002D795806|nr:S8 family serine peptidase [Intrasporangium sp.]HET7399652.1 S8 family serine peptidase [Intrasporangium sp.]